MRKRHNQIKCTEKSGWKIHQLKTKSRESDENGNKIFHWRITTTEKTFFFSFRKISKTPFHYIAECAYRKTTDNLFIQKFNCIKSNQTICTFTFLLLQYYYCYYYRFIFCLRFCVLFNSLSSLLMLVARIIQRVFVVFARYMCVWGVFLLLNFLVDFFFSHFIMRNF